MNVSWKPSTDGKTISATWTPVAGCDGYGFFRDGRQISRTLDPKKSSVNFGVPDSASHVYDVKPFHISADPGSPYTFPVPTKPTGVVVVPPQGTLKLMDGAGTQDSAVFSRDNGSPDIGGLHVQNYLGYGIGNMAWSGAPVRSTGRSKIHDSIAEKISANPPRSRNGTAEAGFWLGQTTDAYNLTARFCAWMAIWTGAAFFNSNLHDFECTDNPFVNVYLEHQSQDFKMYNFILHGMDKDKGGLGANLINIEWWYNGQGSKNGVIDNFEIYVPAGVNALFADAGTCGLEIAPTYGKVYGPGNFCVLPNKLADPSRPNVVHMENIDFTGLTGSKVSYHNNAMGVEWEHPRMTAQKEELHPDTIRMTSPLNVRLAALHASLPAEV